MGKVIRLSSPRGAKDAANGQNTQPAAGSGKARRAIPLIAAGAALLILLSAGGWFLAASSATKQSAEDAAVASPPLLIPQETPNGAAPANSPDPGPR